jgi:hypothetical protein
MNVTDGNRGRKFFGTVAFACPEPDCLSWFSAVIGPGTPKVLCNCCGGEKVYQTHRAVLRDPLPAVALVVEVAEDDAVDAVDAGVAVDA